MLYEHFSSAMAAYSSTEWKNNNKPDQSFSSIQGREAKANSWT